MIFQSVYQFLRYRNNGDEFFTDLIPKDSIVKSIMTYKKYNQALESKQAKLENYFEREQAVLFEIAEEIYHYIFSYAKIESPNTLLISTSSRFNISVQLNQKFESIVNFQRINDIRFLNKFFETVNSKLPLGGLYINHVETKNLRKKRILKKFPLGINYIYYLLDFILKRIFPKFSLTKKLYFLITRGNNRVLTKAETFGRLYSCGFEVIAEKQMQGHLYFISRKVKEPYYPKNPTYGPIIKLNRIGKEGKKINVYKLRTMHPFAEFLQEYVFKTKGLQKGGKFNGDFRVSTLGKILRTFWLDELPMLFNVLKGELKIVGVRPLSQQYFDLYDKDLQKLRIKYRPGLIPPFYADLPSTLEDIMESERKYLELYAKHPLNTDLKYFCRAMYNIIFKRSRSN